MSDAKCATCGGPFEADQRVCHFCGTSRQTGADSSEQRAELEEFREALAAALHKAEEEDDVLAFRVRDRFLQNALLPSDPDVLLDAAMHTHTFMAADVELSDAPRARFESCLTRLELLAVDDPKLSRKAAILRSRLDEHRRRRHRSNLTYSTFFVVLIGGMVALGVWVVRRLLG